jgi:hypothetical protein
VLPLCLTAAALHAQVTVLITLSTSANALQGNQTATLTALVTGTATTGVTWSVSPSVGTLGTAIPGTGGISTNTYKAPALISSAQTVTVKATSVADPTQAASVQIQLQPITVAVSISPTSASLTDGQMQQFTANVTSGDHRQHRFVHGSLADRRIGDRHGYGHERGRHHQVGHRQHRAQSPDRRGRRRAQYDAGVSV